MTDWMASGLVPVKFSECVEYNQKLNSCCRHIENMTGRVYKTDISLPFPDLFIVTCICGRNHRRLRVDPVNGAPTSIFDHPYESGVHYE
jgi:hypothetical protein